jgi:hypothetical protein
MWIKSGTGFTQPREDNWVATLLRSSGSIKKVNIIRLDGA